MNFATPRRMRSHGCVGQNTPPLSTDIVHVTSNIKDIYSRAAPCHCFPHCLSNKCFQTKTQHTVFPIGSNNMLLPRINPHVSSTFPQPLGLQSWDRTVVYEYCSYEWKGRCCCPILMQIFLLLSERGRVLCSNTGVLAEQRKWLTTTPSVSGERWYTGLLSTLWPGSINNCQRSLSYKQCVYRDKLYSSST